MPSKDRVLVYALVSESWESGSDPKRVTSYRRGVRRLCTTLTAVLILIAGCATGNEPTNPPGNEHPPIGKVDSYVALGDSFVSGPGIDQVDPASKDCQRSNRNYPTLLSMALKTRTFADVSCAGASTIHILDGANSLDGTPVPPQLDAISADTQLVTVGIGANNSLVLVGLLSTCRAGTRDQYDRCAKFVRDQMPRLLKAGSADVVRALDAIARKAPRARIVLVSYLRVVPEAGACPAAGFQRQHVALVSKGEKLLDASQADAAKEAGVDYVSLSKMSRGHDACAGSKAWVNALKPPKGDGAILHPNAAGMRAAADAVADHLRKND